MPTQQVTTVKGHSGRSVVIYRDGKGRTRSTVLNAVHPRPASPVLSAPAGSTSGGTLAAGTYSYRVSATVGGIEGLACTAQTGTVASGTTGSVALTWAAVTSATAYQVYGRTAGSELLIVSQAGTTYTDTGSVTPSGALPTLAKATVDLRPQTSGIKPGATSVPQAVAMRGSGVRFFKRFGTPAGYTPAARS